MKQSNTIIKKSQSFSEKKHNITSYKLLVVLEVFILSFALASQVPAKLSKFLSVSSLYLSFTAP